MRKTTLALFLLVLLSTGVAVVALTIDLGEVVSPLLGGVAMMAIFALWLSVPTLRGLLLRRQAAACDWTYESDDGRLGMQYHGLSPDAIPSREDRDALARELDLPTLDVGLPLWHYYASAQARRVVRGTCDAGDFVAFDLVGHVASRRNVTTYICAVTVIRPSAGAALPWTVPVTVVPRRRGDQWEPYIGKHDIEVDPELARRFAVRSRVRDAAAPLFTPAVRSALLSRPHEAWQVREDCWILLSMTGMWPRTLSAKLAQAQALRDAVRSAPVA